MINFPSINKLCSISKCFDHSAENDELFFLAMKENFNYQYEKHDYMRFLCKRESFSPNDLNEYKDIFRIPALFVGTMKIHGFTSVAPDEIALTLTSSGTAGQKTQTFFDKQSLNRLEELSGYVFRELHFESPEPAHYFVFNYERTKASDIGTAWSAEQKTKLAPVKSMNWTIVWNEDKQEYVFDLEKWTEIISAIPYSEPIRFVGFPAFIYKLVQHLKSKHPDFKVNPQSFVIAGGGWKNHSGDVMTQPDFARFLETSIGLPSANVRDTFGMAEHGVPYGCCSKGFHHVPIYSRIAARHPLTSEIMPLGKEGLLQLFTPFNTSQLNLSVLSTDVCTLSENCECGMPGLYISSIRRGGIRKHKGCAIAAQEILNKQQ